MRSSLLLRWVQSNASEVGTPGIGVCKYVCAQNVYVKQVSVLCMYMCLLTWPPVDTNFHLLQSAELDYCRGTLHQSRGVGSMKLWVSPSWLPRWGTHSGRLSWGSSLHDSSCCRKFSKVTIYLHSYLHLTWRLLITFWTSDVHFGTLREVGGVKFVWTSWADRTVRSYVLLQAGNTGQVIAVELDRPSTIECRQYRLLPLSE